MPLPRFDSMVGNM